MPSLPCSLALRRPRWYRLVVQRRPHLVPRVPGFFHRAFVFDGRDVAGVLLLGHSLQHAPHDLTAARLGQHVHEVQFADYGNRSEFMAYLVEQLLLEFLRRNEALLEYHECRDHFAAQFVGPANDARFRDRRMAQQSSLDFDGADAMTGNLDDLIGTASKPDITVLVDLRRIASVIDTRNNLPIIAAVAFRFTPQFRGQSRKGPLDYHDAFFIDSAGCTVKGHHFGIDARHGERGGPRLNRQHSQTIRIAEHGPAGFGLPHMIDHGNLVLENLLLQPLPSWRVQHFARAKHPFEILVIGLAQDGIAVTHQ